MLSLCRRLHRIESRFFCTINQKSSQYDLTIECSQLSHLNNNGWRINFSKANDLWYDRSNQQFELDKETSIRSAAVSGALNTGKTFILNNLCRLDLPSNLDGYTATDIRMKTSPNNEVLFMETDHSAPIVVSDTASISDKVILERILQDTLYELVSFHICVVGNLTWIDQQEFDRLHHKIRTSPDEKYRSNKAFPLIVVHNLKHYSLEELKSFALSDIYDLYPKGMFRSSAFSNDAKREVIDYFIEAVFESEKKWFGRFDSTSTPRFWFDSKGDHTTYHVFLVNNETRSGRIYNYFVFRQIEQFLMMQPLGNDGALFSMSNMFKILDSQIMKFASFKTNEREEVHPNLPITAVVHSHDNYHLTLHPELKENGIEIYLKQKYEIDYEELFIGKDIKSKLVDLYEKVSSLHQALHQKSYFIRELIYQNEIQCKFREKIINDLNEQISSLEHKLTQQEIEKLKLRRDIAMLQQESAEDIKYIQKQMDEQNNTALQKQMSAFLWAAVLMELQKTQKLDNLNQKLTLNGNKEFIKECMREVLEEKEEIERENHKGWKSKGTEVMKNIGGSIVTDEGKACVKTLCGIPNKGTILSQLILFISG